MYFFRQVQPADTLLSQCTQRVYWICPPNESLGSQPAIECPADAVIRLLLEADWPFSCVEVSWLHDVCICKKITLLRWNGVIEKSRQNKKQIIHRPV